MNIRKLLLGFAIACTGSMAVAIPPPRPSLTFNFTGNDYPAGGGNPSHDPFTFTINDPGGNFFRGFLNAPSTFNPPPYFSVDTNINAGGFDVYAVGAFLNYGEAPYIDFFLHLDGAKAQVVNGQLLSFDASSINAQQSYFIFQERNYNLYSFDGVRFDRGVVVSAAPEPSAWLLLIAGVGVAGFALRSARRSNSRSAMA